MFGLAPQSRRISVSVWVVPAGCDLSGLPDHPASEQEFIQERPESAPTFTARSAQQDLIFPNVPDTMGQNLLEVIRGILKNKVWRNNVGEKSHTTLFLYSS